MCRLLFLINFSRFRRSVSSMGWTSRCHVVVSVTLASVSFFSSAVPLMSEFGTNQFPLLTFQVAFMLTSPCWNTIPCTRRIQSRPQPRFPSQKIEWMVGCDSENSHSSTRSIILGRRAVIITVIHQFQR